MRTERAVDDKRDAGRHPMEKKLLAPAESGLLDVSALRARCEFIASTNADYRDRMRRELLAEFKKVNAAGREKIVGRYESETIDPAWSNATRQALMAPSLAASDQIRATHSEPSGLAVDCRSTTCRITADFPNRIAADDWSTFYLTGAGDRLPNATLRKTTNPDGSVRLEIYAVARR